MIDPGRRVGVTVTPFIKANIPDLDEVARQTEILSESRTDAILPCASTGDFVKMTPADRVAVLATVAKANKGRKKLIAGACEASTDGVISAIEDAKKLGYNSCIVCPPYYYPLGQDAVLEFYTAVNDAAEGMPIVAYHVPFFTTGIELSTYRKLLALSNIVGIKDSSANMKLISHRVNIKSIDRPEFLVYTGTDDCLFPALCAGCYGSMTALAASLPDSIADIYDAYDAGDIKAAQANQRKIMPILRLADSLPFPVGYKLLAMQTGLHAELGVAYHDLAAKMRTEIVTEGLR